MILYKHQTTRSLSKHFWYQDNRHMFDSIRNTRKKTYRMDSIPLKYTKKNNKKAYRKTGPISNIIFRWQYAQSWFEYSNFIYPIPNQMMTNILPSIRTVYVRVLIYEHSESMWYNVTKKRKFKLDKCFQIGPCLILYIYKTIFDGFSLEWISCFRMIQFLSTTYGYKFDDKKVFKKGYFRLYIHENHIRYTHYTAK